MAEACGARCNKAGKVTNYIRDETPPSKMSNRKKALLFLVVLMLVIVVIAIAEMLKLLVNVGMIAQSIEFGRESYEAVETHLRLISESFQRVLGPMFAGVWASLASITQFFQLL